MSHGSLKTCKSRMCRVKRERRADNASFRQMARTLWGRLSFNWGKLWSSATHRMLQAVTSLESHISQNRTGYVRDHERKIMTRRFHAALKTCRRHKKISKREMREAKKKWKEAMENVKEEDRRRVKLWGEIICVSESNQ